MKRILLAVAAVAVTTLLSVTSEINAKDGKDTKPNINAKDGKDTKTNINPIDGKDTKYFTAKGGARIKGYARGYRGYRSYCYYPPYRCYLFFDPATRQWYFWSDRIGQVLPISSIAAYPPTTSGANLLPPGTLRPTGTPGTPGTGAPGTGAPALPTPPAELPPGATPLPTM